jgi:hypothetical protein
VDVGQDLLLGLAQGQALVQLGEQPGGLVHGADEVGHLAERLGGGLHDQVDASPEDVEIEVGDQSGDLDQRVGAQVESGHLTVDPDESLFHVRQPTVRCGLALRVRPLQDCAG